MANLRISELDFDTIKQNLKRFISTYRDSNGDLVFSDYDFEGSGISVLLDLLSYNTHYNAYYANMVLNEMFLDSAVKRESAVSLSKHLGYTPRSYRSAKATVSFSVSNPTGNPTSLTLDQYTPFSTQINGKTYTFVNLESKTIEPVGNIYVFSNIVITEGIPLEFTARVNTPGPDEKYEIPNENVDTTTLIVKVQKSNTDTTTEIFTKAEDTVGITGSSKVYFIEESPLGRTQLVFGDNILGKKLTSGNFIKIQYLISNGEDVNVSSKTTQSFSTSSFIGGGTIGEVTTISNSNYGITKESIESIKYYAPKFYASQNRAVTSEDYKVLINSFYPSFVNSVAVWGGDENIPKKYGKIMISLLPADGYDITDTIKNDITTFLTEKKMLTLTPEFVEPEIFFINIDVSVKYNPKLTGLLADDIKQLVQSEIRIFFNNLKTFDSDFYYSQLTKVIDESDDSIIGNLTSIKLQKRLEPIIGRDNLYIQDNKILFYIGIIPASLETTRFIVSINQTLLPVRIKDIPNDNIPNYTGEGTLVLYNAESGEIVSSNYGSINYGTGEISINNLLIYGYSDNVTDIRLMIQPQNNYLDITVNKNQIILLDDSIINGLVNRNQGLTVTTTAINA